MTCLQVEAKTNNRIKDLISPDSLDGLTRLVLVNAIYFKVCIYLFPVKKVIEKHLSHQSVCGRGISFL